MEYIINTLLIYIGSRKRARAPTLQDEIDLTQEDEIEILSQASSSGNIRPTQRLRSRQSSSSRSRSRRGYVSALIDY